VRLVFSSDAEADLEEIGDFIAEDNPAAAISFVQQLRQRCRQVAEFPGIGRRRSDLRSGYRSVTEGDYVILYRLASESELEIVRVVHGMRDLGNTLTN
jgi:toxin ParE1/3/4